MADEPNTQTPTPGVAEVQEPATLDWASEDTPEREVSPPVRPTQEPDGDDDGDPPEVEATAEAEDDPAPEFWTADAKALWSKVTDPALRAALKDMNGKERAAVASKFEEAATRRKEADAEAGKIAQERERIVKWFETVGPQIKQQFANKWGGATPQYWQQLAHENPAEFVRVKAAYDADAIAARDFERQRVAQSEELRTQAANQLRTEKVAEHAKLAADLPGDFGTPEKAQATYDTLSKYLLAEGIPAARLSNVYEASIVKIVQKAYKYDQLQAKAKGITDPKAPGAQPATQTPRRIQPGPASNGSGNRETDAHRQAMQRLRNGERLTAEEGAAAFR